MGASRLAVLAAASSAMAPEAGLARSSVCPGEPPALPRFRRDRGAPSRPGTRSGAMAMRFMTKVLAVGAALAGLGMAAMPAEAHRDRWGYGPGRYAPPPPAYYVPPPPPVYYAP